MRGIFSLVLHVAMSFSVILLSSMGLASSPTLPNLPANFCTGTSVSSVKNGKTTNYSTIQSAINNSKPQSAIAVPQGTWNELVTINNQSALTVFSPCSAQVYGFKISSSQNIVIEGFKIVGLPSGSNGIEISGAPNADNRINIVNNEITGIQSSYKGISVSPFDAHIQIVSNNIHNNLGDGIYYAPGTYNGSHLIQNNTIVNNGQNGIVIPGNLSIQISQNSINYNGQLAKNTANGYGIKVQSTTAKPSKKLALTNNKIIFNNGLAVTNSTRDISGTQGLSPQTVSGNTTTTGTEGAGVAALVDVTPPMVIVLTQGNLLTNQPQFNIQATITDESPVTVTISQNGIQVFSSNQYNLSYQATLQEGMNNFQIQAVDYFGNTSAPVLISNVKLDTTPPVLAQSTPVSGQTIYTNTLPYTLNISAMANEAISGATVDGQPMNLGFDQMTLSSSQIALSSAGTFSLSYSATDLAGNIGTLTTTGNLIFDNTPPQILLGIADGTATIQSSIALPITITDQSPTSTELDLDGVQLLTTPATQFTEPIQLPSDGVHTISVTSTDAAGNVSTQAISITLNSNPLVFTLLNPADGSSIVQGANIISFTTSTPLVSATVTSTQNNYTVLIFGPNQNSGQVNFEFNTPGSVAITIAVTDIYGRNLNQTIHVNVQVPTTGIWAYQECPAQ